MKENVYAYKIGNSLYLNITNKCTNDCTFCIRNTETGVKGYNLWLNKEPDLTELLETVGDVRRYHEVVFCGYGEPLQRAQLVIETARELKKQNALIRINTNGQGDLINGYSVAPMLSGVVDTVSISLNAPNPEQYVALCKPAFGEKAYWGMLDFTKSCLGYIPKVVLSVVSLPGMDMNKCRSLADNLGVELRIRHYAG